MGSSELLLARERVDALLQAQNRLRVLLDSNASSDQAATASPKLVELRQLLGRAVRTQTEQQHEIDTLRAELAEERTISQNARHAAENSAAETAAAREQLHQVQQDLSDERQERMESEAAAMEREEQLQGRVEQLEEEERRRVALEKAMAEVEPPPAMPAAMQMQVVAPPPQPASNAGFAASAGGFEL